MPQKNETHGHRAISFRGDIEGLRGACVLLVVLYHARLPGFAGGYVGVDAFFVLSGFLVTSLIVAELDVSGRFDIASFWARRMRRLLPNSLAVLLTVAAAAKLLTPLYLQQAVGDDLFAAATFRSNGRFAERTVDYHRAWIRPSPLLHFWSLNLEEQFYFLFPIAALAVAIMQPRRARVVIGAVACGVAVSSLWFNLIVVDHNQPVAYFSLASRAWQPLTGCLLAVTSRALVKKSLRPGFAPVLVAIALVSLVGSAVLFRDGSKYPGHLALVPVIATLTILAVPLVAPSAIESQLLSNGPLRWLGGRSYSWYLWHWPVLVFVHQTSSSFLASVSGVVLSLFVADLAFRFVETPLRHAGSGFAAWKTLVLSLVAVTTAAGVVSRIDSVYFGSAADRERLAITNALRG